MIITQKYNSAADIDPEFIPDLEKLLSDCVPSFEMIKQNEQKADDSTHFAYYLFFGQKSFFFKQNVFSSLRPRFAKPKN